MAWVAFLPRPGIGAEVAAVARRGPDGAWTPMELRSCPALQAGFVALARAQGWEVEGWEVEGSEIEGPETEPDVRG